MQRKVFTLVPVSVAKLR